MFSRIWTGLARLGDAFHGLADTVFTLSTTFREANAVVRQRLELTALPAPVTEQPPLLMAQPEPEATVEPSGKNGRRKSAASA